MTKCAQVFLASVTLTLTCVACNRPLLGTVAETYVNQNDPGQTLELVTKETLKGFIHGRSPNPAGRYTLLTAQRVTVGEYTRARNTLTFKSKENQEFKATLQEDSSLRDEAGNIWQFQGRSRSFRSPDEDVASR